MNYEGKGRKESASWDFVFQKWLGFPKVKFWYWQKVVVVLMFCFGKTLERSYKTSTVNSYTCHLDSPIVNIFSMFALWFSVFAEWPQTLETDIIILFYL